jgi:hypothetical protein
MAIITTNGSFGATAAVTSTTLNAVADAATFDDPVDGTSLELKVDGKLGIKDAGVTTAKIADANVTKAKIENISAPLRVLGRTTAGAGVVEEITINDEDDMANASAITLATDESIKAYVDSLLQYQLKYSGATGTFSSSSSFADLDLSGIVGSNRAMVVMEVFDASSADNIFFRTKGSLVIDYPGTNYAGWGASGTTVSVSNNGGTIILITDSSGIIEHQSDSAISGINYTVQAFQKLA